MQVQVGELLAIGDEVDVMGEGVVYSSSTLVFRLGLENTTDVFDRPFVDGREHGVRWRGEREVSELRICRRPLG